MTFTNGTPVTNADVYLTYGGYTWKGNTDSNGFYSFGGWYYGGPSTLKVWYLNSQYDEYSTTPLANSTVTKNFALIVNTPTPDNKPPIAQFSYYIIGDELTRYYFDALESTDADGSIVQYSWDFGDGYTDSGIKVSHTYLSEGRYSPTLTVTDNLGATNTYTSAIEVRPSPQPFPVFMLIAAMILAAAILFAIVILFLWLKKTLKVVPETIKIPCDGKTQVPVKVSYTNGFGRAVRQRSDLDVEMKTTSGSIHNVTILEGKSYAKAMLVPSNEFGRAVITAKAENKAKKAEVDFVYDKAAFEVSANPGSIAADGKSTADVTLRIRDGNGNIIAPIEEMVVLLQSTMGEISSPVKIVRGREARSIVVSPSTSGTATITAISGDIKGEGRIVFADAPRRYCMLCGAVMAMEDPRCAKCRSVPPSGVDVKTCGNCDTVIPEAARFCHKCGASQPMATK